MFRLPSIRPGRRAAFWAVLALALFGALPAAAPRRPRPRRPSSGGRAPAAPGRADPVRLTLNLDGGAGGPAQMSVAVQIVLLMTLLTVAPSLILLMTSFTRIVIVLGFVRTALGVPNAPANQIIIGLSLFLTCFIMAPVAERVQQGRAPALSRRPCHLRPTPSTARRCRCGNSC